MRREKTDWQTDWATRIGVVGSIFMLWAMCKVWPFLLLVALLWVADMGSRLYAKDTRRQAKEQLYNLMTLCAAIAIIWAWFVV